MAADLETDDDFDDDLLVLSPIPDCDDGFDWSGDELLFDENSLVSELDNYLYEEDFILDSK